MRTHTHTHTHTNLLVCATNYLSRDPRTRMLFSLHAKVDSGFISQTSTRIGEKKRELYFRHGALFISFHRNIDAPSMDKAEYRRRGLGKFNLRNPPAMHYRSVREIQQRRELRFAAIWPIRISISHIIRQSIDSYVDTPRKISWELRARLVTFRSKLRCREFAVVHYSCLKNLRKIPEEFFLLSV